MPGISGRTLAEALRKLRPSMKVVFVSGYTDDVALLQQLHARALFFLQETVHGAGARGDSAGGTRRAE